MQKMTNTIADVELTNSGDFSVCHILGLSDELKEIIRSNISSICHGSHILDYVDNPLYNYQSTIRSFIERYEKKTDNTRKGMIGEFLSHILITTLFDNYEITSAFFNLEEKSIKKGFDLMLYDNADSSVWITEVKSGNLHKDKTHDQTTSALLNTAKGDLKKRLNEQKTQYWHNAINHVRSAVHDEADYRTVLLKLLRENLGKDAAEGKAKSQDKNVFLISNLFASLDIKISEDPAKTIYDSLSDNETFKNTFVFTIQKETYEKVVDFLRSEIE